MATRCHTDGWGLKEGRSLVHEVENAIMQGWKMQEWNMREQTARVESAGVG